MLTHRPTRRLAAHAYKSSQNSYEFGADFMRRCKGYVMVSINDNSVFGGFSLQHEQSAASKAYVNGKLMLMNWQASLLGSLFRLAERVLLTRHLIRIQRPFVHRS